MPAPNITPRASAGCRDAGSVVITARTTRVGRYMPDAYLMPKARNGRGRREHDRQDGAQPVRATTPRRQREQEDAAAS